MHRPLALWIRLRSSLWFVPTLVVLGSMLVAHGLVEAGARLPGWSQPELPRIFGFSAEGSLAMLSAIATSMMTIAGVAFSITIVVLSLTSSQYSPRVLRQFMRDRANQLVLGVFVGVFAFCLTLLPRVGGGAEEPVPAIAVAASVLYAIIGIGCLIFFVHHVATSIQVSAIVSEIAVETHRAANEMFPQPLRGAPPPCSPGADFAPTSTIHSLQSGYIQLVDEDELVALAVEHDVVVRMEHRVGEFVIADTPLVSVAGMGRDARQLADRARAAFTIDRARTIEQDVLFGARQITDIALRALSPALNDPTTATLCVDHATALLHLLASRRMGPRCREHEGRVRLHVSAPDFADLLAVSYAEIRRNAGTQVLVLRAILRGLELLSDAVTDPARQAALAAETKALSTLLCRDTCDPTTVAVCRQADRLLSRWSVETPPSHPLPPENGS